MYRPVLSLHGVDERKRGGGKGGEMCVRMNNNISALLTTSPQSSYSSGWDNLLLYQGGGEAFLRRNIAKRGIFYPPSQELPINVKLSVDVLLIQ